MNRYQHPSERSFDFDAPAASRPSQSRLIEAAARCHFITSKSKATTTTTDNRTVADNEADVTILSGPISKSNLATDGSVLLQGSSSLQTGGLKTGNVAAGGTVVGGDLLTTTLDFAGARIGDDVDNSSNLAGSRIGSSEIGSITITDTGGDILSDALDRVTGFATLAETGRQSSLAGILALGQRSEQNRADADENTGDTLADLLDAVTESKTATDPEAQKNKTILWIVLATLAFLFFRK